MDWHSLFCVVMNYILAILCMRYGKSVDSAENPTSSSLIETFDRFIGSNDQCVEFCKTRYKVKLDLSSDDLERYMRENIRLACVAKDQILVWACRMYKMCSVIGYCCCCWVD